MTPRNSTCDTWLTGLEDSMTPALGARGKLKLADTGRSSAWGQMRGVIQGEGVLWRAGGPLAGGS